MGKKLLFAPLRRIVWQAMGLLRIAAAVTKARPVAAVNSVKSTNLPFFPVDWAFRFFPYMTRDRVRFMYRCNQIYFGMGFFLLLGYYARPFHGDNYDHIYASTYYARVRTQLYNSGQLEENLRIKV